jgi:hypothetical protein
MSSWKRWAANPKVQNFLENMVSRHSGISALQTGVAFSFFAHFLPLLGSFFQGGF